MAFIYLLTCDQCNGEYCETTHFSAYSSIELSKKEHWDKYLDHKMLKGEDASNEWKENEFGDKDILEFRTGNWGYVVWKIRKIQLKNQP